MLGVPRDATPAQVTEAYRVLVRALHPDTGDDTGDAARLADVLAAYAVLRDPGRRAAHDAEHPRPGPTRVPVRVHHPAPRREPDLRAGPVRRHPG